MTTIASARTAYADLCTEIGTDPLVEETVILGVDREFLPACALAVLDGGDMTVEYYEWLTEQTLQASQEQQAEVAAGYEH